MVRIWSCIAISTTFKPHASWTTEIESAIGENPLLWNPLLWNISSEFQSSMDSLPIDTTIGIPSRCRQSNLRYRNSICATTCFDPSETRKLLLFHGNWSPISLRTGRIMEQSEPAIRAGIDVEFQNCAAKATRSVSDTKSKPAVSPNQP